MDPSRSWFIDFNRPESFEVLGELREMDTIAGSRHSPQSSQAATGVGNQSCARVVPQGNIASPVAPQRNTGLSNRFNSPVSRSSPYINGPLNRRPGAQNLLLPSYHPAPSPIPMSTSMRYIGTPERNPPSPFQPSASRTGQLQGQSTSSGSGNLNSNLPGYFSSSGTGNNPIQSSPGAQSLTGSPNNPAPCPIPIPMSVRYMGSNEGNPPRFQPSASGAGQVQGPSTSSGSGILNSNLPGLSSRSGTGNNPIQSSPGAQNLMGSPNNPAPCPIPIPMAVRYIGTPERNRPSFQPSSSGTGQVQGQSTSSGSGILNSSLPGLTSSSGTGNNLIQFSPGSPGRGVSLPVGIGGSRRLPVPSPVYHPSTSLPFHPNPEKLIQLSPPPPGPGSSPANTDLFGIGAGPRSPVPFLPYPGPDNLIQFSPSPAGPGGSPANRSPLGMVGSPRSSAMPVSAGQRMSPFNPPGSRPTSAAASPVGSPGYNAQASVPVHPSPDNRMQLSASPGTRGSPMTRIPPGSRGSPHSPVPSPVMPVSPGAGVCPISSPPIRPTSAPPSPGYNAQGSLPVYPSPDKMVNPPASPPKSAIPPPYHSMYNQMQFPPTPASEGRLGAARKLPFSSPERPGSPFGGMSSTPFPLYPNTGGQPMSFPDVQDPPPGSAPMDWNWMGEIPDAQGAAGNVSSPVRSPIAPPGQVASTSSRVPTRFGSNPQTKMNSNVSPQSCDVASPHGSNNSSSGQRDRNENNEQSQIQERSIGRSTREKLLEIKELVMYAQDTLRDLPKVKGDYAEQSVVVASQVLERVLEGSMGDNDPAWLDAIGQVNIFLTDFNHTLYDRIGLGFLGASNTPN